jgi:cyanophycinase-like exopeptidase
MSAAAVATLALLTAAAPLLQLRSHLPPLNASAVSVGGALLRRPDRIRIVVGGSLQSDSPILDYYRGFPPNGVKYITAAGTNPVGDGASIGNFFAQAGINAEWIQIHNPNCEVTTRDPAFVQMVEQADAIYMSGGQSGRVQSCLYGSYDQSGHDPAAGEDTPVLAALRAKSILGGSSAGAMNQPESEILITGHSAESCVRTAPVGAEG